MSWAIVRAAFEDCCDLPPLEQAKYLEDLGRRYPELRAEVASLLDSQSREDSRFERPCLPVLEKAYKELHPVTKTISTKGTFQPRWFGKYVLLRELGQGGMATVYLARHQGPGGFQRLVALKCPLPEYARDETLRKLFEYEAKITGVLSHPNIVPVYDFFEVEGTYTLTMEFIEGKDLAQTLRKLPENAVLPLPCALYIASEICRALKHSHQCHDLASQKTLNIVHRDVSPRNIMMSYEGDIKLLDFGIAKADGRENMTQAGAIRGTIGYLSPEAVVGGNVDFRSDLFSLCSVLFRMVTGSELYSDGSYLTVLDEIKNYELPKERLENLSIAPQLKGILLRGLARDPDCRYQSARDLEGDLMAVGGASEERSPRDMLTRELTTLFESEIEAERNELSESLKMSRSLPPQLAQNEGDSQKTLRLDEQRKQSELVSSIRFLPEKISLEEPIRELPGSEVSDFCEDNMQLKSPSNRLGWVLGVLISALIGVVAMFQFFPPRRSVTPTAAPSAAVSAPAVMTPAPSDPVGTAALPTQTPVDTVAEIKTVKTPAQTPVNTVAEIKPTKTPAPVAPTSTPVVVAPSPVVTPAPATRQVPSHPRTTSSVTPASRQSASSSTSKLAPVTFELELSHNARIYLEDQFLAEAKGGQVFELTVEGREQYNLRFVNEQLGINIRKRITTPTMGTRLYFYLKDQK